MSDRQRRSEINAQVIEQCRPINRPGYIRIRPNAIGIEDPVDPNAQIDLLNPSVLTPQESSLC